MNSDAQTNEQVARRHADTSFRLGPIYWLAVCNDGMRLPDELHDDFDSYCWEQAFNHEMPNFIGDGEDLAGELMERSLFGFLACAEIQQPSAVHASGYSTRGWGCYWRQWVYSETVGGLYAKAADAAKVLIDERVNTLRDKAKP